MTSIDLSVNPESIAGMTCGSHASFTYTAVFHIPAQTAGGIIQFAYPQTSGHAQTSGSLTVGAGETSKAFQFTSSGIVDAAHTYPPLAMVAVTSPNQLLSPQVKPSVSCVPAPATFQVTSVSMAVNPTSIAGTQCGMPLTVTYTATFHLAPNGPGGTILFDYTINNGRSANGARLTVAPGQTKATYSFTWSGNLPVDHTYPGSGGVMAQSPNAVNSPLLAPTGICI